MAADTALQTIPHHTCDRCATASAVALARLATGGTLAFCAHHLRAHETALADAGATVTDASGRILTPAAI